MANTFSKEERVAFEDLLAGFNDELVMSKAVGKYQRDATEAERTRGTSGDTIWRPVPYIAESISGLPGTDISSSFKDVGQLSVPSYVNTNRTVPWLMDARELRDALQNDRFGKAAAEKIASDINVDLMTVATDNASLVVPIAAAAGASSAGFTQVASCETIMNEQGVPQKDRFLALSTGDYNGLASDLASRGTLQDPKTLPAYERAYVGQVAGFATFKLDYANTLTIDAITTVTINGADQRHVPVSTTSGSNVDNREQTITIGAASGTVKVGDRITIAGVNAVHHITKVDTGNLKTFVITEIVSGGGGAGDIKISPPIIAADSTPGDIETQYKNVTATPANGAAITPLNIAAAKMNPFWYKDAIEILPGHLAVPADSGAAVIRGTTENGLEMVLTKQYDIDFAREKYRLDCLYGVVCTNPEMVGVLLFSQA